MEINNKLESIKKIKSLGLNQFPEKIINSVGETRYEEALKFMQTYPAKYYTLRDKSKNGGPAFHIVLPEEMEEKIKVYSGAFSILVSSYNYKDNQLVVGEVQIIKDKVYMLLSFNGEYSIRDVYKHPDMCINTTIFDDKTLNGVPHFDEIYKFILDHNLQGVVVEFGLFDRGVGLTNDKFIIYEIRTNY